MTISYQDMQILLIKNLMAIKSCIFFLTPEIDIECELIKRDIDTIKNQRCITYLCATDKFMKLSIKY